MTTVPVFPGILLSKKFWLALVQMVVGVYVFYIGSDTTISALGGINAIAGFLIMMFQATTGYVVVDDTGAVVPQQK